MEGPYFAQGPGIGNSGFLTGKMTTFFLNRPCQSPFTLNLPCGSPFGVFCTRIPIFRGRMLPNVLFFLPYHLPFCILPGLVQNRYFIVTSPWTTHLVFWATPQSTQYPVPHLHPTQDRYHVLHTWIPYRTNTSPTSVPTWYTGTLSRSYNNTGTAFGFHTFSFSYPKRKAERQSATDRQFQPWSPLTTWPPSILRNLIFLQ